MVEAPERIETGALDDRQHLVRQYAVAVLGWVATVALIVWLVVDANEISLRLTLFLTSVAVLIALLGVVVAVQILRPPLIAARRLPRPPPAVDASIDALGRPVTVAIAEAQTGGEVTVDVVDGVRRFVSVPR